MVAAVVLTDASGLHARPGGPRAHRRRAPSSEEAPHLLINRGHLPGLLSARFGSVNGV